MRAIPMRLIPIRAIPLAAIALAAVVLMLTACAHWPEYEDDVVYNEDGVPCEFSLGAPAVFIDIDASPAAPPPPPCEVDRGTRITFRGTDNRTPGFLVRFSEESPAGPDAPREIPSEPQEGRQKARLSADNQPGDYPYAIVVRGVEVDPVIIIRQ